MQVKTGYYIGIDVGTGSARACLIDHTGEILSVASENIGLWQPEQDYYVCFALEDAIIRSCYICSFVLESGLIAVVHPGAINIGYLAMYLLSSPACAG